MQSDDDQPASFADNWPSVLNRMLIGIGVIALGFLVVDKALDMFNSHDESLTAERTTVDTLIEKSQRSDSVPSIVKEDSANVVQFEPAPAPINAERPKVAELVVVDQQAPSAEVEELVPEQNSFVVTTISAETDSQESVLEQLEQVFGSAVVIVSANEPAYVETENERRFLIGSILKNDRILSSISTGQLVVSRVGEQQVFELPDMSVQ
ncbi:MAG: hypothetical protein AB8B84_00160 [Granulosicoccus sp.]